MRYTLTRASLGPSSEARAASERFGRSLVRTFIHRQRNLWTNPVDNPTLWTKAGDNMKIPVSVRRKIYQRDGSRCCICSQYTVHPHLHHRKPRGMGGSSLPESCALSNLLTLCSVCHLTDVEIYRQRALLHGWLVPRPTRALDTPVFYRGAWVLLDDDGGMSDVPSPSVSPKESQ